MRHLSFSSNDETKPRLPARCSVDVSCLHEEVQGAVLVAIEENLRATALAGIDLTGLDGVTVAVDCHAAARALQNLPRNDALWEIHSSREVMEMARIAAVRRDGDVRFHIVVRPGLVLMAIAAEKQLQRVAQACIAHEGAHVEHETELFRMFPECYEELRGCGDRSAAIFIRAMDIWSEYAACRSSAMFRPEAGEEFEGIFCEAVVQKSSAGVAELKEREQRGGGPTVLPKRDQVVEDMFVYAGYLLGHTHGADHNLKERTSRLEEVFRTIPNVEPLIDRLECVLSQLWIQRSVWSSIEVFAPIYDLILERKSQLGLPLV